MSSVDARGLLRRLARWTVPPGEQALIRGLRSRLVPPRRGCPEMEAEFARNTVFRDRHRGERCFVLATGPSIGRQDLRPLRNEVCIAVSYFFLHPQAREVDPLYHVDAAAHEPLGFDDLAAEIEGIRSTYTRATLFFGHSPYERSVRNFLRTRPDLDGSDVHYLDYCASPLLTEETVRDSTHWDLTQPLLGARTVIYSTIQLAAYLGCSEIYLLGCDHDYLTEFSRGRTQHFYRPEHGHDDAWDWPSAEELFLAYHYRWKHYRLMADYLRERGTTVYNATEGGMLDVFPCVSLADVLAERR